MDTLHNTPKNDSSLAPNWCIKTHGKFLGRSRLIIALAISTWDAIVPLGALWCASIVSSKASNSDFDEDSLGFFVFKLATSWNITQQKEPWDIWDVEGWMVRSCYTSPPLKKGPQQGKLSIFWPLNFRGKLLVSGRICPSWRVEIFQVKQDKSKPFATSHLLQELGEVWLILIKACWISGFRELQVSLLRKVK